MIEKLFYDGDATGSRYFRIPFLWTTAKGTLVAGSDANFGSTGDSAENIDVTLRLRSLHDNAGEENEWQDPIIPKALHMRDFADEPGYKQKSASFIDAVIFEDRLASKRLFMHVDAWVWNGGLFSYLDTSPNKHHNMRQVARGDGFCSIKGKKYLLLSSQNIKGDANGRQANINSNTDRSRFDYCADLDPDIINDSVREYPIYHLTGQPEAYTNEGESVSDAHLKLGPRSSYTLNQDFELMIDGELLYVRQQSDRSNVDLPLVPMKIFYEKSVLQMYNTSYILQLISDDGGQSWQTDRILNSMVKSEFSKAYITGPGRGVQIIAGPNSGRLIAPVYYQEGSSMYTEVIYSDDAGRNWSRGGTVPSAYQTSEAAPVALIDGSLKLFMRNTHTSGGSILEATSTDGGISWSEVKASLGDNDAEGVNCQVSAIRLSETRCFASVNYQIILLVSAKSRARKNGCIFVGRLPLTCDSGLDVQDQAIEWYDEIELSSANTLFGYSCLTELPDGRIAVLYESSETDSWEDGLRQLYYREIEIQ